MTLFFILYLIIVLGVSYLSLRYFQRFTAESKYRDLWNLLIFLGTLCLLFGISFVIFINTVTFER